MFKKDQLAGLMKKAQEMQANMQKAQEELFKSEVVGESGAGLVKVTMNGKYRVKQITLDESLLKEDKEIMEDLIVAAINAATDKVEAMSKEKVSSLTGEMGLPAGMKLPF